MASLQLYNSATRRQERFVSLKPGKVGIYLCGPTVYSLVHLGNARSAVTFDLLVRYLRYLKYDVCYVRNITDVGHLTEIEGGEDKIIAQAKREACLPMAVAQKYRAHYDDVMKALNVVPPTITPCATGHITEQIFLAQQILKRGMAYEVEGSLYFDLPRYHAQYGYGQLSGRKIEEMRSGSRPLLASNQKRHPLDFALWKAAPQGHLMYWNSPWGDGFPAWHLECTAMSAKYLGLTFDIHGGGLDLCFPHHECEIAQAQAAFDAPPARYWLHHNLVTWEGQKMSKSKGNAITVAQILAKYPPMVLRFFLLQTHYRSPLNFTYNALEAAQTGYYRLMNGLLLLEKLETTPENIEGVCDQAVKDHLVDAHKAMQADLHTPKAVGALFGLCKIVQRAVAASSPLLSQASAVQLSQGYTTFVTTLLGLKPPTIVANPLLTPLVDIYKERKKAKDQQSLTTLRKVFASQGIAVQERPKTVFFGVKHPKNE